MRHILFLSQNAKNECAYHPLSLSEKPLLVVKKNQVHSLSNRNKKAISVNSANSKTIRQLRKYPFKEEKRPFLPRKTYAFTTLKEYFCELKEAILHKKGATDVVRSP